MSNIVLRMSIVRDVLSVHDITWFIKSNTVLRMSIVRDVLSVHDFSNLAVFSSSVKYKVTQYIVLLVSLGEASYFSLT